MWLATKKAVLERTEGSEGFFGISENPLKVIFSSVYLLQ